MKKALVVAVVVILLAVIGIGWLQQKKGEEKKSVQSQKEEPQRFQLRPPSSDNVLSFDGSQQAPEVPPKQCGKVRLVVKF